MKKRIMACSSCQEPKPPTAFPLVDDSVHNNNPKCSRCIIEALAFPRTCDECGETKPEDQYDPSKARNWSKIWYDHRTTISQVEAMAKQAFEFQHLTCLACDPIRKAWAEQAARERELKAREEELNVMKRMKEHNVQFYDFDHPVPAPIQYSRTKPTSLSGTYDIIFHKAYSHDVDTGTSVQNRTTKGKVTIAEGPDTNSNEEATEAHVRFHPDMRSDDERIFQQDFNLTRGSHQSYYDGEWVCKLRARMVDDDDFVNREAILRCVAQRAAIPWTNREQSCDSEDEDEGEQSYDSEDEDGDMVTFETLQEAEAMAQAYENGPDVSHSWLVRHKIKSQDLAKRIHGFLRYQPKPVFFLEPGDLILHVNWADNYWFCGTDCILRRRSD